MQSKTESLIEAALNIGSGFFVSLAVWVFVVVPVWDLDVNMTENLQITVLFTLVSITRSYVWRRIFNRRYLRKTQRLQPRSATA